jgi:hypothetical protein
MQPGLKSFLFLDQHSKAPSITTGTIGAAPRLAKRPRPDLNGVILPSSVRVPSGKIVTPPPFLSFSRTFLIADISGSPSFTGMALTEAISGPKNQLVKSVSRARKHECLFISPAQNIGSR